MANKVLSIAIIGMGARGSEAYGLYMFDHPEKFKIVAICDIREDRLAKWGKIFDVPQENRFTDENEFFKEKRADVCFVTTQDRDHVRHALEALKVGYDIVCEKPISDSVEELQLLNKTAKECGRTIMVCHVLRYTVMIRKLKEVLDSGAIGQLVSLDHTENVVYWHEAHSYVRGNWRNREASTPMIMAKCCHDLDLLQFFAGSKCKAISSMGDLRYFKHENKIPGSANRCTDCKFMETCPYSAKRVYVDAWKRSGADVWPFTLITETLPLTEEALWEAIKTNNYGRCVFDCDNNVVDNQTSIMTFENGVIATLNMEAFVRDGGRRSRFFGTLGELEYREDEDTITLKVFGGETKVWKVSDLAKNDAGGHGGGDYRLLEKVYDVFGNGNTDIDTALEKSLESHYMALAAEESRLNGGQLISLEKYRK